MNAVVKENSSQTPLDSLREHRERLATLTAERAALDAQVAIAYEAIAAAHIPTPAEAAKLPPTELDLLIAERKTALGVIFLGQKPARPLADIDADIAVAQSTRQGEIDKGEAATAANDALQAQIQEQHGRYLDEMALAPVLQKQALIHQLKAGVGAFQKASADFAKAFVEFAAITAAGESLKIGMPNDFVPIGVGVLLNSKLPMPVDMPGFAGGTPLGLQQAIARRAVEKIAELNG
jgi:hypothetical protein